MTTSHRLLFCLLAGALSVSGCGDDDKPSRDDEDVSDAGKPDRADASVDYKGPVRGGTIPGGPDYEEPDPDDGPFDASVPCCEQTLTFAALDGETSARIEADFAALDGAALSLANAEFSLAVCMPLGVAVQHRLHVSTEHDGGHVESVRIDANTPSFEDAEGAAWNLFVLQSCEE